VLRNEVSIASAERIVTSAKPAEGFDLPTPESARPGIYELSWAPIGTVAPPIASRFEVLPGTWKPDAPRNGRTGEPTVRVWSVGRTINGLNVLRAATDTFDHDRGVQIAELDVDRLRCRCGLSCASESPWGYGFAGVELRGVKRLAIALSNTFSKTYQEGLASSLGDQYLDSMAGLMIDFHTARGYSYRVALGLGVLNMARPVAAPHWGKSGPPDRCLARSRTLLEKPKDRLVLDLGPLAPPGWDGQAWVSVGVDTVSRGLMIEAMMSGAPK
jgi:hypothetical protein